MLIFNYVVNQTSIIIVLQLLFVKIWLGIFLKFRSFILNLIDEKNKLK